MGSFCLSTEQRFSLKDKRRGDLLSASGHQYRLVALSALQRFA
jgi:hypothetical protein